MVFICVVEKDRGSCDDEKKNVIITWDHWTWKLGATKWAQRIWPQFFLALTQIPTVPVWAWEIVYWKNSSESQCLSLLYEFFEHLSCSDESFAGLYSYILFPIVYYSMLWSQIHTETRKCYTNSVFLIINYTVHCADQKSFFYQVLEYRKGGRSDYEELWAIVGIVANFVWRCFWISPRNELFLFRFDFTNGGFRVVNFPSSFRSANPELIFDEIINSEQCQRLRDCKTLVFRDCDFTTVGHADALTNFLQIFKGIHSIKLENVSPGSYFQNTYVWDGFRDLRSIKITQV